jgi:hypothetical protein
MCGIVPLHLRKVETDVGHQMSTLALAEFLEEQLFVGFPGVDLTFCVAQLRFW